MYLFLTIFVVCHLTLKFWDERNKIKGQTIEQIWFAGVHSNIGGGYRRSGLSDITLEWMTKKATDAGLLLWPDHRNKVLISPNHDGKIYPKKIRKIPTGSRIHTTVFSRIDNKESLYNPSNIPSDFKLWNNYGPVGT